MHAREELLRRLHDLNNILALIGTSEHLHLECKTWPGSANDNDVQRAIAKALCGFSNADGGVLVIGLATANGRDKYTPDLIEKALPVADTIALKSRIDSLIPELVEPAIEGVSAVAVQQDAQSKSGFIVIDIPPTSGP